MKRPIYLDSHATTPTDPRVLEVMLPLFTQQFGNASSEVHRFGQEAGAAVDRAREELAAALGAEPQEIVFTSGATEANALALEGFARAIRSGAPRRVVSVATEHKAVLEPLARLAREGWDVELLPVRPDGVLDVDAVREALRKPTALVSVMHGNNEIGVLQDIAAVGALCEEAGAIFHTDATQTVAKVPINVQADYIHLLSCCAHKVYGPKGVGALYVRRGKPRFRLAPLFSGGGQERGLRGGTLNTPGIVGFAKAVTLALTEREEESARLRGLRDRLRQQLIAELDQIQENGAVEQKLPQNLSITFRYCDAVAMMNELQDDLAVSSGSACSSTDPEASHVLLALGLSEEDARCTLRFGLSRFTTEEEIDFAAKRVVEAARKLRGFSAYAQP